MSTTVRAPVDIPAFVDHAREFNREARRIVNAPAGDRVVVPGKDRLELAAVLEELEETVKALRAKASAAAPAPAALPADPAARRPAWVLDSTPAMVGNGLLLTPLEFQQRMGWSTRQAVSKAAQSQRVFSLEYQAQRYFPAFYADPAYERRHLEEVSQVLGDLPGGSKLQFFLTRKGSLGGATPLEALAAGRIDKVRQVAAAFAQTAEQGG